jgi:hypothetical protein
MQKLKALLSCFCFLLTKIRDFKSTSNQPVVIIIVVVNVVVKVVIISDTTKKELPHTLPT